MAVAIPCTCTGVAAWVVVPFPSCPEPFIPQPHTVPPFSRTRLKLFPAAASRAPLRAGSCAGT